MGIPFYFKKLTSEFSNIVSPNLPSGSCNRLFLDFNCGIHYCVGKIRDEYAANNHQQKKQLSHSAFEDMLIKRCAQLIDELVRCARPKDLLYVSIDGIPPMAKITQQRKRRYFNDWKRTRLLNNLKDNNDYFRMLKYEWNSNCITPGTSFMCRLMKSLQAFCDDFGKDRSGLRVILSPFQDHGEGEHKICHYIRNSTCDDDTTDVIYGLDADMILLGMLSKNANNTFLMREPMFYNISSSSRGEKVGGGYMYMSIERTMSCVCEQWCSYMDIGSPPSKKDSSERAFIVKCYVVLTFLLGNDFLPNLSYLRLRENGLETLMKAYRTTYDLHKQHILLPPNNELNLPFLASMFDLLSLTEDTAFKKAEDEYFERTPPNIMSMIPGHKKNALTFESKKIEFYPMFHKFPHRLFGDKMQGWRTNYYFYLFDHDPHTSVVTDVCASYIRGIVWCCDYYFNQRTNWAWFYKYNYSPTILDVYNYASGLSGLPRFTSNDAGANNDYVKIDEQLLMVIPPSSKFILPNDDIRQYTTDVRKGLVHLFPTDFDVVTYMRSQLHECGGAGINLDEKIKL